MVVISRLTIYSAGGFPGDSVVKNLLAVQESRVQYSSREGPMDKEHCGVQSIGSQRSHVTE